MTVAVACLCNCVLPNGERQIAVITAADRMLTNSATEWEPDQSKTARITESVHAIVCDDYSVHSKVQLKLRKAVLEKQDISVHEVAEIYFSSLKEQHSQEAVDKYLTPIGLTLVDLNNPNSELRDERVRHLTEQIQNHPPLTAEALVVGCDEIQGHLYVVNCQRIVCETDIGWATIGTGMWQAASEFRRFAHSKGEKFHTALLTTYGAKKAGEQAAGVGPKTDIHLITRDGTQDLNIPIDGKVSVFDAVAEIHRQYVIQVALQRVAALSALIEAVGVRT